MKMFGVLKEDSCKDLKMAAPIPGASPPRFARTSLALAHARAREAGFAEPLNFYHERR